MEYAYCMRTALLMNTIAIEAAPQDTAANKLQIDNNQFYFFAETGSSKESVVVNMHKQNNEHPQWEKNKQDAMFYIMYQNTKNGSSWLEEKKRFKGNGNEQ